MGGPETRAVELAAIAIVVLAILGISIGLRRRAKRRRRALSLGTAFPDDSHPGAQERPPEGHWVGWMCRHDHPSVTDAMACAREQLRTGTWDGRTWTW
jgi:hypothetical protein